jgi:hypothetical protein
MTDLGAPRLNFSAAAEKAARISNSRAGLPSTANSVARDTQRNLQSCAAEDSELYGKYKIESYHKVACKTISCAAHSSAT